MIYQNMSLKVSENAFKKGLWVALAWDIGIGWSSSIHSVTMR